MGRCDPGLKHIREMTVTQQDTAIAFGSGDVPVLSTPSLLALAEAACVDALEGEVPEGQTSVGAWAEVEHLQPTPVGANVCAKATLIGHHGRRLEFNVSVAQGDVVIAKIRHRRVLVDRQRFLAKL
ncbi:MAG: hotdog domain-containing protein [Nitriliruptoraceae bacterium]